MGGGRRHADRFDRPDVSKADISDPAGFSLKKSLYAKRRDQPCAAGAAKAPHSSIDKDISKAYPYRNGSPQLPKSFPHCRKQHSGSYVQASAGRA